MGAETKEAQSEWEAFAENGTFNFCRVGDAKHFAFLGISKIQDDANASAEGFAQDDADSDWSTCANPSPTQIDLDKYWCKNW